MTALSRRGALAYSTGLLVAAAFLWSIHARVWSVAPDQEKASLRETGGDACPGERP